MIDGVYRETDDGGSEVWFDRRVAQPVTKVWTALVDPAVLANWLGDVAIEPRVGGRYVLTFRDSGFVMTGTITVFEHERVLEYTWLEKTEAPELPPSVVRWELSADGDDCRLVLTHRFPQGVARKAILPFMGGWHAFLDVIGRGSAGEFVPYQDEKAISAQYRAKYLGEA
jgi:uncharacterized protein YndB with AHSA1/START domain